MTLHQHRRARGQERLDAAPPLLPPTSYQRHAFPVLAERLRARGKNKSQRKRSHFPFYSLVRKSSRKRGEAERQSGGFYLGSHPLAMDCGIIVPGLCLCPPRTRARTRARVLPSLSCAQENTCKSHMQIMKFLMCRQVLIKQNTHWRVRITRAHGASPGEASR